METTANKSVPFYPIHPGEILKDEIAYRGISQRELARQMGYSYTVLNEILNSKRPVNAEFALLIEAVLGIDAEPLLKMQANYNMQIARKDKTLLERLSKIRKIVAAL